MTVAQKRVLKVLDRRKMLSPQEVAEIVNSRPGPITRCLDALEHKGLVASSWSDRHGYRYTRTPKGATALT